MNPILRNILAVIAGFIAGSLVNMALVTASGYIIPPPSGADVTTVEGLRQALPLFEAKHFIMPFLAHALGTFAGAYVCAKVAAGHQLKLAMLIGLLFFAGGLTNILMLPSPVWFSILDLTVAYIPMAYLGFKLAKRS